MRWREWVSSGTKSTRKSASCTRVHTLYTNSFGGKTVGGCQDGSCDPQPGLHSLLNISASKKLSRTLHNRNTVIKTTKSSFWIDRQILMYENDWLLPLSHNDFFKRLLYLYKYHVDKDSDFSWQRNVRSTLVGIFCPRKEWGVRREE